MTPNIFFGKKCDLEPSVNPNKAKQIRIKQSYSEKCSRITFLLRRATPKSVYGNPINFWPNKCNSELLFSED